jgi:hypothetical protein
MFRSFVNDAYLERYYPNIVNFRQGSQVDYSDSIDAAFELVLNELTNKGIDPRLCMVPIDLNRSTDATTNIQQLTSVTTSATLNSDAWEGKQQRRFVVDLTSKTELTDDWSFILQGSNKIERPDDADSTWVAVSTIQYDGTTLIADIVEENATFSTMYKWYRVRAVKSSGTGSVTFTASLWDTNADSLIAFKALELIAMSWKTGLNPKWDDMRNDMADRYEATMQAIKLTYDEDQDGIPEVQDEPKSANVRMTR